MQATLPYLFPLILLLFEWGLRAALKVDTSSFFGPTLAAAALSFLIPLTKPVEYQGGWAGRRVLMTSRFDASFVSLTWVLILLGLFAWASACYFSLTTPTSLALGFPTHTTIGGIAYVISLVMTSLKEKT